MVSWPTTGPWPQFGNPWFKVKVVGGIKVKSNGKDEEKHLEEKILVKQFHSQCNPDAWGFCKFHIEPSKVASKTTTGYISFYKDIETEYHAHESNEIYKTGYICVKKHLPESYRHIDDVPIILESGKKFSEEAKPVSETDIFEKLRRELASEISEDWQEVARRLGMQQPDLYRFKYNDPYNMKEQISAMPHEWFRKKAEDSKWLTELVEALDGAGRKDLAERVEDMYTVEKKRLETL